MVLSFYGGPNWGIQPNLSITFSKTGIIRARDGIVNLEAGGPRGNICLLNSAVFSSSMLLRPRRNISRPKQPCMKLIKPLTGDKRRSEPFQGLRLDWTPQLSGPHDDGTTC